MREFDMLENLREQIDRVDEELLILLKRRMQISKKIASYKLKNDMEILQSNREQEVINKLVSKSVSMDLDSNFILKLFESILDESKKIQEKVVK